MYEQTTLNCNGQLLDIEKPIVMGILNTTPDSFFAKSRVWGSEKQILAHAERLITEGSSILDFGGMSSRPGAEIIDEAEEMRRVLPAIEAVKKAFPTTIISIDTIRASVAKAAVEVGASIINDISAGNLDEKMFVTVAKLKVPYILMHMKATPKTMQSAAVYDDITLNILDFFIEKIGILRGLGVKDIVVDAGFGFGKTLEQNYELLRKLSVFKILDCPLLVGLSRKSMIYKSLNITSDNALNGTTAAHTLALMNGAKILRVHDVKEAVEAIKIYNQYLGS